VVQMVKRIRQRQARIGIKKLHKMITPSVTIGRDYMFRLLSEHGLIVKAKKRHGKTTQSGYERICFPNLIKNTQITRPNQAWVVDITYINSCDGFVYLYLVTDLFSRKILGHFVSDDLYANSACLALKVALATSPSVEGTIHHSDHGIQYVSKTYQMLLADNKMVCSLTGKDRCYENAVAERINGILKHELGLSMTMPSIKVAKEFASEAINIYGSLSNRVGNRKKKS